MQFVQSQANISRLDKQEALNLPGRMWSKKCDNSSKYHQKVGVEVCGEKLVVQLIKGCIVALNQILWRAGDVLCGERLSQ